MPEFGGDIAVWNGSPATWGAAGIPAPPCDEPLAWGGVAVTWDGAAIEWRNQLYGQHAERMLRYLPDYYLCTPEVRAILQAEGYEVDAIAGWITIFTLVPLPESCPDWALPMWEQMMGLVGRAAWSSARRHSSIANNLGTVITEDEVVTFLAEEVDGDPADFTVTATGLIVDIFNDVITDDELLSAEAAAARIIPAHINWFVGRTP